MPAPKFSLIYYNYDIRFRNAEGLSQSELAERGGVGIRIIQAYEQRMRDINKARLATIVNIAQTLDCDAVDLFENNSTIIQL